MAYTYLTWLANVLRNGGCTVREVDGWRTRGRPRSTGEFSPSGVLIHHTASTVNSSDARPHPALQSVIDGRSDLPGPLAQVLIDWRGWCYVVAAGRANHAGVARASGPMPAGDGNELYVGIEIDYNYPAQENSTAQYSAALTASASILRRLGSGRNYVRGHRETSTTGKSDPGAISMANFRTQVGLQI